MPLDFALRIMAKLLCSCLCLFDAIVELHVVDEKMIFDVIYIYIYILMHCFYFVIVVEAFITLNCKF